MAGFLSDELDDDLQATPDDIAFGANDENDGTDEEQDSRVVDLGKLGPLLELDPEKAARYCLKLWEQQNRAMNRRKVKWRANYLRRLGVPGVRMIRTDYDRSEYTVWAPPGGSKTPPVVNKAARLCRRVEDNLFADPPLPDAEPSTDSDEDRAAAEFATRVLIEEGSESGYNNLRSAREAFSKASTYGSGFRFYYIDPNGAGHRPREILASPRATTVGDGERDPLRDPQTGMEDPNPVVRYVAKDGKSLTDDASDAQLIWVEKVVCEVLTGHHVRFLPETCRGIGDADGALIASFVQWGHLKNRFPDAISKMDDAQIRQMGKYRPEKFRDLLPDWLIDAPVGTRIETGKDDITDSPLPDDAFVFVLRCFYKATPTYPMGCYFLMGGNKTMLHRETWIGQNTQGGIEPLDIPIDQTKQFHEGYDDPYGMCLMDVLGPQNEIRNAQWGSWIEHLDRFNARKIFLPMTSILQPKQMQQMTGTYMYINPGGQPFPEEIPPYPKESVDLLDRTTEEMNDESGLQQAAQGLEVPEIKSGVQANYTVEQANKALSEIHQNAVDAQVRGWRITQQLIKTGYTTPRKLRYLGEDNAWKEEEWTGSDLGSTRDVSLQEGSFTMQTPSQKATIANQYAQAQVLDPQQYKDVIRTQIQPLLAIEDNPHLLRIRRQLGVWKDGPSKDLQQRSAAAKLAASIGPAGGGMAPQAATMAAGAMGPGVPQLPAPPDPLVQAAQGLFARLPVDLEPQVAAVRHNELQRVMAGGEFLKQPPEWQTALINEYQQMRQAAGVMTLSEQSQSQQNQMHQQVILKEIPQIVERANVDATTVYQTTQQAMAAYQGGGQPQQGGGAGPAPGQQGQPATPGAPSAPPPSAPQPAQPQHIATL